MRSVTFVDRLTLEVNGTVAQNGVCLGDVNGDGDWELVVGTEAGELLVFKGDSGVPWLRGSGLGFITAVGVGDLMNLGHSVLVVASGCGWINIFDLSQECVCVGEQSREVLPLHTQRIPANVKDLIMCDYTGRGSLELVVSLTDRVVRTYRWVASPCPSPPSCPAPPLPPPPSTDHTGPGSSSSPGGSTGKGSVGPSLGPGETEVSPPHTQHTMEETVPGTSEESNTEGRMSPGRLVSVNKWEFASQIGTVTCNVDSDGRPALLVAQPGGAFMKLQCQAKEERKEEEERRKTEEEGEQQRHDTQTETDKDGEETLNTQGSVLTSMSVEYEPLGVNRRRNPNVSAEILGGFSSKEGGPGTRYAIVTLDGTVLLVDHGAKDPMDSIMWNLHVDHQLMCLSKLDVTGDGIPEVIACSWDGATYLISQDRQAVRFQFEESVSTFTAGMFSLCPGVTVPALVYITFNGRIQVYHNLGLERGIMLSSLVHCPGMVEEAATLLAKLGVDSSDMKQLQQVYSYCLYGLPQKWRKLPQD